MDVDPGVNLRNPESDQSPRTEIPIAPSLTAVIAQQTHMLQKIVDAVAPEPSSKPFSQKVKEFFKLKPPTFDHADNPIDADDWLRGIKRRLELVKCTDKEGLNIATLQLRGIANSWWDCFCAIHPDPANIGWAEFAQAFREYHLMEGTMAAKAEEFRNLQMGTMTVREYTTKFIQLMRYVPEFTETEKQRRYYYMRGLPQALKSMLVAHDCSTLKKLINIAALVEIDLKQAALEKDELRFEKRKMTQPNLENSRSQRLKVGDRKLLGPPPQQAQGQLRYPPQGTTPQYPVEPIPEPHVEKPVKCTKGKKKKKVIVVCHICHRIGHKDLVCPQLQQFAQPGLLESRSPPTRGLLAISSRDHGRLNHVTTKDAIEAPEVVLGKIEVEGATAVVLFDSGATYS